jgi:putative ABC transport system permease protein
MKSMENKADTAYEYMYTYKYPDKAVPSGGEVSFAKELKKKMYGYNLDVTLRELFGEAEVLKNRE